MRPLIDPENNNLSLSYICIYKIGLNYYSRAITKKQKQQIVFCNSDVSVKLFLSSVFQKCKEIAGEYSKLKVWMIGNIFADWVKVL